MAVRCLAVCALVLALGGCTTPADAPDTEAPSTENAGGHSAESVSGPTQATTGEPQPPEVQALPRDRRGVAWVGGPLPRLVPADGASLPRVLEDPHPARLVYHPVERLDDTDGWAGEQLFFFGLDRQWRILDMADLGLPDAWWPGADTYGSGALSHDGHTWAAHTAAGVVLLDLESGSVRHVDFPAGSSLVRHVAWLPGRDVLSAYAARRNSDRYRTFHLGTQGRRREVRYPGSRTRFDVDGTPIQLTRSGPNKLTVKRWENGGARSFTWELDVAIPRAVRTPFGVFGDGEVAFYEHRGSDIAGPARIWVLDKHTGATLARLQVPATTSIQEWSDATTLGLLVDNHRMIEWQPPTGGIRRILELPGPYPNPGEWAAATIALPSR